MKFLSIALSLFSAIAVAQIPTPRQDVLAAMRERPDDPWPRGQGHVVLALPGSLEGAKSYHEPGGSFSPEFGSFGVSLWIADLYGTVVATSDTIPLSQIHQTFVWHDNAVTPSIRTDTTEYISEWSVGPKIGTSELLISPRLEPGHRLMFAIRSVGPSGAAIESLQWSGKDLLVNGRYTVRIEPSPVSLFVGPEGYLGWTMAQSNTATECHGQKGWCYARLELPPDRKVTLQIMDTFPPRNPELTVHTTRSALEIGVPDSRFVESLNAQVAHIMMSLVGNQTRPADPNQHRQAWLRDGAYQVVALARAGELDTARELTGDFAERDFFGGFGAEGDNPGLALWVLEEVTSRVRDPAFDQYLWPHVYRKAEFILGMQSTRVPVERIFSASVVPIHRALPDLYELAQPPKNGLIEGRMDNFHPAMYVTSVSYGGLISAAQFAERTHHDDDARRWRAAAARLQQSWASAYRLMNPVSVFKKIDPNDPHAEVDGNVEYTFIGMWAPWIAADRSAYKAGLDANWAAKWDSSGKAFRNVPLWTYFSFEMADQFVLLGDSQPTWASLEWFWDHQTSPGLYSWWEGDTVRLGEENSYHEWDYARGWVHPPNVTPHYQTAAACLLTQLDMLTYVDRSGPMPTLVIGAGIPSPWVTRPMHVHGIPTSFGRVDWDWNGKIMSVRARTDRLTVRLGKGFPRGTRISSMRADSEE